MTTRVRFETKFRPHLLCNNLNHEQPITRGVHVDLDGWMVVTDDELIVAVPCEVEGDEVEGLIPPAFFKHILEGVDESSLLEFTVTGNKEIIGDRSTMPYDLLDLPRYDWRPVFQGSLIPGVSGVFNPDMVCKAMVAMGAYSEPIIFTPYQATGNPNGIIVFPGGKSHTTGRIAIGGVMPLEFNSVPVLAQRARLETEIRDLRQADNIIPFPGTSKPPTQRIAVDEGIASREAVDGMGKAPGRETPTPS